MRCIFENKFSVLKFSLYLKKNQPTYSAHINIKSVLRRLLIKKFTLQAMHGHYCVCQSKYVGCGTPSHKNSKENYLWILNLSLIHVLYLSKS